MLSAAVGYKDTENEGNQLRIPKTTGQMRHLKKKNKSSRENDPKKRNNRLVQSIDDIMQIGPRASLLRPLSHTIPPSCVDSCLASTIPSG
ncbi:hypothetical protein STEG23_029013, partial [Scotinomys teguina]